VGCVLQSRILIHADDVATHQISNNHLEFLLLLRRLQQAPRRQPASSVHLRPGDFVPNERLV
jgi:hypothetical protein